MSQTQNSRWLLRQEVTESLVNKEVLVRNRSGKVFKATILSVKHDKNGTKCVRYQSQGKRLTREYHLLEKVTDFALS